MALITEDIVLSNDGWIAIVLTGTVIFLTQIRGSKILYRFGITSTSTGTVLDTGESITTDETIYIKPIVYNASRKVSVTISKD